MRRTLWAIAIGSASGCVTVQQTSDIQLSSEGVFVVTTTADSGSLRYDGRAVAERFDIGIRDWGRGSGKRKATMRQENNRYEIGVVADALVGSVNAWDNRSGVDFDIVGPGFMHIDAITTSGTIELHNVEGSHVATGSRVFGRNVVGDANLYADRSGIDMQILPYQDGIVYAESISGDVDLYLPRLLDYDLNVIGDPEHEMVIEDLGFDVIVLEPGLAIAWRGRRSVRVDVLVTGGDVRIFASR